MTLKHKTVALSIFAGLLLWVADAVVDSFFFHDTPLLDSLILAVPIQAICIRLAGMAIIITLGVTVARGFAGPLRAPDSLRESEQKYHHLFENLADAAFLADPETGLILETNQQGQKLLGRTRDEIVGMHQSALHPPDKAEQYKRQFTEHIRKGRTLDAEAEVVRKDGTTVPVWISASTMSIGGRRLMLGIFRDITERKRVEEALRESERRQRKLLEHSPDFVILMDQEGTILYINRVEEGRTVEEVVGGKGYDFVTPETRPALVSALRRAFEEKSTVEFEAVSTLDTCLYCRAIALDENRAMLIGTDITERKKAEHELDIRNTIAESFLTVPDEEVYGDVLRVVLEAMDSKYGVFGYIDEDGALVVPSMTRDIWDKCQVPDKKIVFPRQTWGDSAWPRAIREKSTQYSNESSTLMPEGHVPITRNIVVPIIYAEDVVGILSVANKDTDYTQEDIRLLETIGGAVAPVLNARLQIDRAGQALRESTKRFRTLIDQAADAIFAIDMEGRILDTNKQACRTLGYTRQELLKLRISDIDTETASHEHRKRFWETVTPGQSVTFEGTQKRKDGTTFPVEIRLGILEAGPERTLIGLARDITERKRAEEAVKRSREELRALAARLETVREEERAGLARKIHDDVGHILAALKMDLAWLGGKLAKASDNLPRGVKIAERLESMSGLLDETIRIIRQTASELRPGLLDDVGLDAAIEWQTGEFQRRTGVKCTFTGTAEEVKLDREQSTALFRICQELLTNVARHAGATAVSIALKRQSNELVLEVSDNGRGIKEEQVSSSMSLGILGMRERTLVLGGAFSITGKGGKGTTATVRIPLGDAGRTKGD